MLTLGRRYPRWLVVLGVFVVAGLLDALHGYVGYTLAARPAIGYTLRGQPVSLLGMIARSLPSWIVMGLCAGVALRVTKRHPLFSGAWKRAIALHVLLAVLFAVTFLVTAAALRHHFFLGAETGLTFREALVRYYTVYFNTIFMYYWGTVGVYSAFLHYRDFREGELLAERLERGLAEARLQALQQQVHPHFLFNTLNAISGLALSGNRDATVRALSLLGELLRATLHRSEQVVAVGEELDFLATYLDILDLRFGDRLSIRTDIEPDAAGAEIPTFLLQPLVENAVRHGIAPAKESGWIEIAARLTGERVRLTVTDSGHGVGTTPVRSGIGLRSCRARLRQRYGADFTLEIGDAEGAGARVLIDYPYRRAEELAPGAPTVERWADVER